MTDTHDSAREALARIAENLPDVTKGPWRVGPVDDTRVEDAEGNEVAQIDGDYNQPDTWHLMEANASHIAACDPSNMAAIIALVAEQDRRIAECSHCPHCDGTGDVHRIDGEYLGVCGCDAGQLIKAKARIAELEASRDEYTKKAADFERRYEAEHNFSRKMLEGRN